MRAVVQDRYGPPEVLFLEDVAAPAPKPDELLVRVRASTVTRTDAHARRADPFLWRLYAGVRRPKWRTLGVEMAGEVVAIGSDVTRFAVGDAVFGCPGGFGTHAELIAVREHAPIAHIPAGQGFPEAAALCDGALQALETLRAAGVRAGQQIVIYGASGSLGTAAVQLAKHLGAHVTGVCNTPNVEIVRSLGADEVVDYLREDFTKRGRRYDAIIDAVGKYSFLKGRPALKPGGTYVATDLGAMLLETVALAVVTRWAGRKRVQMASGGRRRDDVLYLKGLVEAGALRAVIDRTYPMNQVIEAHRYVETLQKTGNVVLIISEG